MAKEFHIKDNYDIDDLISIVALLRAPGGCPWDADQTHQSIKANFIEETYEVVEAINKDNPDMLREELGDILLQVALHTQIEQEKGSFTFNDVANDIVKKLVVRHPHVFSDETVDGVAQALNSWDAVKLKTKGQKTQSKSMLSVPKELPALMRAQKVQKKAAKVGFDWDSADGAFDKMYEELDELKIAMTEDDASHIEEELGDVLFSAVNIARFLKLDSEEALTGATDKFVARFQKVEQMAAEQGIDMKSASPKELDRLWNIAKK